jgi:hypothetical protein
MKQFLVFTVLFGMVLIHIPRSYIHECSQVLNEGHDHDDHSSDNDLPSFSAEDCDLCMYSFHALDLPDYKLVTVPNFQISNGISSQIISASYTELNTPDVRGPPNSLRLS